MEKTNKLNPRQDFLIQDKTFGGRRESIYNGKDKQVESPLREDLGIEKCLDGTDCIMQKIIIKNEPTRESSRKGKMS